MGFLIFGFSLIWNLGVLVRGFTGDVSRLTGIVGCVGMLGLAAGVFEDGMFDRDDITWVCSLGSVCCGFRAVNWLGWRRLVLCLRFGC